MLIPMIPTHHKPYRQGRWRPRARGSLAVGAGLALGLALNALAQTTLAPPPSPGEAPRGAPPVTSTTANGQLGGAPVAPRADQLTPPAPIDATAAQAAAARAVAPVESVQDKPQPPASRASAAR